MRGTSFQIDGPLYGYRASVSRRRDKKSGRLKNEGAYDPNYRSFKKLVRLLANSAGIPDEIPKDSRARIYVEICWKGEARIDGVNVFKAIEDALFSDDRRVFQGQFVVFDHTETESAVVIVAIEEKEKSK